MKKMMKKARLDGGITGQVIEKSATNRKGKPMGTDIYLRCSIQDYFIKFCESEVSRETIAAKLDKHINVKMDIRDGEWDSCGHEAEPVQSRIGTYIAIQKIL